jgi:ABC-2 type transport system permease protein
VRAMLLIAWRGFVQQATSRAFLIGLMLMPLYMLIGGYAPQVSQLSNQQSAFQSVRRHFAVIDKTGIFIPAIDAALARDDAKRGLKAFVDYAEHNVDEEKLRAANAPLAALVIDGDSDSPRDVAAYQAMGGSGGVFASLEPYLKPGADVFDAPRPRFIRVELPAEVASAPDPVAAARPYLVGDLSMEGPTGGLVKLWAILVLPAEFASGNAPATYVADDVVRTGLRDFLKEALSEELKKRRAQALGLSEQATLEAMSASAAVTTVDPDETTKMTAPFQQFAMVGPMLVYLMLFLAVFMTANMVVMSMVEEKSNRVAELLLSCVRAETLMAGKLVAGLFLAFLLVAVWMISASASAAWLYPNASSIVADFFASITSGTQPAIMLVFFAFAYLTVAAFYLAAGSSATSVSDAQAIVAPATLLTLPVFLIPVAIAFDPNGFLARVASFIPIVSPFVMMLRSMSAPAPVDVLIAFGVSSITLFWMIRLVARVFKANLLKPDSTPSFVAFIRDFFATRRAM